MTRLSHTDPFDLKALRKLPYILILVRLGVNDRWFTRLNTRRFAEELKTSIQNASKILSRLVEEGLLEKSVLNGQPAYRLTPRAVELLRITIDILREFLEFKGELRLVGTVISGLGEGKYYMSLEGYVRQFEVKLGFKPYPGTLNVRLRPEYVKYKLYLEFLPGIIIEGFTNGVRTYGSVKCFPALIKGVQAALLLIERTHHPIDIVELAAPIRLRDALGLNDGDEVEVLVRI